MGANGDDLMFCWLRRPNCGVWGVAVVILVAFSFCLGCNSRVRVAGEWECGVDAGYLPERVDIMPLTGLIESEGGRQIAVYVSLLDSSGYQMRWPGIFRFELYERVLRSLQKKGARVAIWPDIDLMDAGENGEYWRDFLRGYEFKLDFKPAVGKSYVLEITFLWPVSGGRRLSTELVIKERN